MLADLLKPIASNLARTCGGVTDAFGLAPLREIDAAGRDLALTTLAQRQAQSEYADVALALAAARQGVDAMIARLVQMGERGETVDSMLALALARLCATAMDGAMHQAMRSPRAQQHIVAIVRQALDVQTRDEADEADEAYREIQELKRELRRLCKSPPAARSPAPLATARRSPVKRRTAGQAPAP